MRKKTHRVSHCRYLWFLWFGCSPEWMSGNTRVPVYLWKGNQWHGVARRSQITGFNCPWWAAPRATLGLLYLTWSICASVCAWVREKESKRERERRKVSGIFLLLAFCFNSHPINCPITLTSLCHSFHNTTPGPVSLAAILSCSSCCLP